MTASEGHARDAHMTLRPGASRSGARERPSYLRFSPAGESGHVYDGASRGVRGDSVAYGALAAVLAHSLVGLASLFGQAGAGPPGPAQRAHQEGGQQRGVDVVTHGIGD